MDKNQINKITNTPFFFIIGRPRSGTTMLRTMLDAHPNILIPLENAKLIHLQQKYATKNILTKNIIENLLNDFLNDYTNTQWKIDKIELKKNLLSLVGNNTSFDSIIKIIYSHFQSSFKKEDIQLIGDKSPINSLYLLKLYYKSFRNAKFIYISRDPRDNIFSIKKNRTYPEPTAILANYWKKSVKQYFKLKNIAPRQIIHVKYEDLLKSPREELKRITSFLSIDFHDRMLEFYKQKQNYSDNYIKKWESTLFKPLNQSHFDLWKKNMSSSDIKKIEYHCKKSIQQMSYENRHTRFSFLYSLSQIPNIIGILYQNFNRFIFDSLPFSLKNRIMKRKFIITIEINKLLKKKH